MLRADRNVSCQLEIIANGTLVHFCTPVERKSSPQRGDMRTKVQEAVTKDLGYKAPLWKIETKVIFCKDVDEVVSAVKAAYVEQAKIVALRNDGMLDPLPLGGIGDYLAV